MAQRIGESRGIGEVAMLSVARQWGAQAFLKLLRLYENHSALFKVIYVNQRLNRITSPLLARYWRPNTIHYENVYSYFGAHPGDSHCRYALYLVRNPHLIPQVKTLIFDHMPMDDDYSREDKPPWISDSDTLDDLVAVAQQCCPDLANDSNWCKQLSEGYMDEVATLLLLICTKLEKLHLTINGAYRAYTDQLALRYISQELGKNNDPLPCLQQVVLDYNRRRGTGSARAAAPFFHLPSVKSLSICQLDDCVMPLRTVLEPRNEFTIWGGKKYLPRFPVGTSSVEELIIESKILSFAGLFTLVRACRGLKKLVTNSDVFGNKRDFENSADGVVRLHPLLYHTDTLEELVLQRDMNHNWDGEDYVTWIAKAPEDLLWLKDSLRQLHCLKHLTVNIHFFDEEGCSSDSSLDFLPPSLKHLSLLCNLASYEKHVQQHSKRLYLPNETLENIFTYVSDDNHSNIFDIALVNKHLSQVARPLRVRHWSDEGYYGHHYRSSPCTISRLALELLRYPELRPQVKSLTFNWFQRSQDHDAARVPLGTENLQMLAWAAEEVVPTMANSTNLCEEILQGWDDALAVLVLAWATNLSSLSISIPYFDPDPEADDGLLVLQFAKQLALRFNEKDFKPNTSLPLGKLQDLEFRHWDTKNLRTYRLGDEGPSALEYTVQRHIDEKYAMPIPTGSSPIESIRLEETLLSDGGLASLLLAPQYLRVLYVDFSQILEGFERDTQLLARSLLKHASSLEELDLSLDEDLIEFYEFPDDDRSMMEDFYRDLTRLKRLGIHMADLISKPGVEGASDSVAVTGRFPASLEYLKLYNDRMFSNWNIKNAGEKDVFFAGIVALLEETGSQGRLKNLKTLDCNQALVDDPGEEGVKKIKHVAERRGVTVLMSTGAMPWQ
ncbi:hypothetical protein F53441_11745 [Fusarium austroafricanum]|uniref:F-box domain-containing protein n=1 Tax=Fusarium austroafricanum TaxID=2364996 RepID=A0A8H4K3C0_9HYPO|nr:hypothetical protein F53441_11745 [Fusarium austroafricanum]